MWMFIFMILPLLAIAYIAWHVWVILPLSALWRSLIIVVGVACFLLLFLDLGRKLDSYPLPLAQTFYTIGTSAIIVMLYLVLVFLRLDLRRADCHAQRRHRLLPHLGAEEGRLIGQSGRWRRLR